MIDTDDLDMMSRRDLVELLEAYKYWLAEVKRLRKRNAWLEEVVGLAVEFDHIDLSDEGWPRWEGEEE